MKPNAAWLALAVGSRIFGRLETRRGFLSLMALGGLSLLAGSLTTCGRRRGKTEEPAPLNSAALIANTRTGVVHHAVICSKHLPDAAHRRTDGDMDRLNLHKSCEGEILALLAREAVRSGKDEAAVDLLREAIRVSPLSYHLYDQLVRLLGRLRRYEEIRQILATALDSANATMKQEGVASPQLGHAVEEFEARLKRASRRDSVGRRRA